MKVAYYQSKKGKYKGMYHLRLYANKKYFHVGRYKSKAQVEEKIRSLTA